MNAQKFLDDFGYIANAPDGVKRLRKLILFFAITGCLSEYKQGDSSSSSIREHSLDAKRRYLNENHARISKRKHAELSQTEIKIPERWTLLPAGDLVHLINGRAFKSTDWKTSGLPIIRIQNLNNPNAAFNYFQGEASEGHTIANGDMLLSWSGTPGTSFGAFVWNGGDAVLNQHIFKVIIYSNLLDKAYLKMATNACLEALIGSARGGVGLKHVTMGQVEALQIPLPPKEEQKRIVAKVDELMALCDKLEAQQQERERRFPVLSRACHARFVEAPTLDNLKAIFDETKTVWADDFRNTILALAVQGKLVRQESSDGSGEDLLDRIKILRRTGTRKEYSSIKPNEILFAAPDSWSWERLGNIALNSDSGWSPKCHSVPRTGGAWGVLKVSAVSWGKFLPEENKALPTNLEARPGCEVKHGDFLLSRANTSALVARSVIVDNTPPRLMMSDKIYSVRMRLDLTKP